MIKLLKYLNKKSIFLIILVVILVVTQVYCDLELPERLTNILNAASKSEALNKIGMLTDDLKTSYTNEIIKNALQMLGFAFIVLSCSVTIGFLSSRIAANYSYSLRKAVFSRIQDFSINEIDKFSTSSLITRTTNDIIQVQMVVVMSLRMAISAPTTAIMGIIKAANIQSAEKLSFIVVISVIALVSLILVIFLLVLPKFKLMQGYTDRLNLVTRENLTGIRVVRAYNAQDYQESKFEQTNIDLTKTHVFVNRVLNLMNPGMMLIMNSTSLAILWVGSYWIGENPIHLGAVFGFQQITMFIVMAFMQLIMIFIMIPRGLVSARRINEVLEVEPSIVNLNQTISSSNNLKGEIEYKNVSFAYENSIEEVIKNISFKANKGDVIAIIGSTGSGKSTLINLLPRFYDSTSGQIFVDGVNIKDYDLKELRDKIGFIAQKALLFKGTIRSNLLYGKKDATDEEMIEALKLAEAWDFVSKKQEGLNAFVAQGGSNFSGGQKQRLSIARALIKKPEILVFDDSFSALDFKTDKILREKLNNLDYNPTRIIVAQRIGTIMDADTIIVLENGTITGVGKHKELLKTCNVYREIAYSQLSKEELDHE